MKTMIIAAVTAILIIPAFAGEVIKMNDFTREDEVYIQQGYNELQGTCTLMAIHEVQDYGMENDFSILFFDDAIAVVNGDSTGTVCDPNVMDLVREGIIYESVKHEEMCYFDESC